MASDRAKRAMANFVRQGQTETVVYRRPAVGEQPAPDGRSIAAFVDRAAGATVMNGRSAFARITVLNDAALGIAATELDEGGDNMDVAERAGGAATTRPVAGIIKHDADWVTLGVM